MWQRSPTHTTLGVVIEERAIFADVPGFCKGARVEDIRKQGYVLAPNRYVGTEAAEVDSVPFEEKMNRLTASLRRRQVRL